MARIGKLERALRWLRAKLGNQTHLGHAIVSLFLWLSFTVAGLHEAAWAFPLAWYLSREERDAELTIRGTVWVKWVQALGLAVRSKDFLYPAAAIAALVFMGDYIVRVIG